MKIEALQNGAWKVSGKDFKIVKGQTLDASELPNLGWVDFLTGKNFIKVLDTPIEKQKMVSPVQENKAFESVDVAPEKKRKRKKRKID